MKFMTKTIERPFIYIVFATLFALSFFFFHLEAFVKEKDALLTSLLEQERLYIISWQKVEEKFNSEIYAP